MHIACLWGCGVVLLFALRALRHSTAILTLPVSLALLSPLRPLSPLPPPIQYSVSAVLQESGPITVSLDGNDVLTWAVTVGLL